MGLHGATFRGHMGDPVGHHEAPWGNSPTSWETPWDIVGPWDTMGHHGRRHGTPWDTPWDTMGSLSDPIKPHSGPHGTPRDTMKSHETS